MESAINLRAVMNKIPNILGKHLLLPLLPTHAQHIHKSNIHILEKTNKCKKDNCRS